MHYFLLIKLQLALILYTALSKHTASIYEYFHLLEIFLHLPSQASSLFLPVAQYYQVL